jgi:hypothetical protein
VSPLSLTPTPEQALNYIVHDHYVNEVVYHHIFHYENSHYIIRCETCAQIGLTWTYTVDVLTMISHSVQWLGTVREILVVHALKHNELVREILQTFNLTRKHQGVTSPYPHGMNEYGCPTGITGFAPGISLPDFPEVEELVEYLEAKKKNIDKKEEKSTDFRRIELDEEKT